MTYIVLAVPALLLVLALWDRYGFEALAFSGMLFALAAAPKRLYGGEGPFHVDITTVSPVITTYFVAIGVCFVAGAAASDRRGGGLLVLPAFCWLLLGTLVLWPGTSEISAGIIHLVFVLLAWLAAWRYAVSFDRDSRAAELLAGTILVIIAIQVVVAILQRSGYPIFPPDELTAGFTGNRVSGTLGHPNNLGKAVLLCICLALPLSRSNRPLVRTMAWLAVLSSIVPLGLSEGRANFAAAGALVLLWSILTPRGLGGFSKVLVPVFAVAAGSLFVGSIIARFDQDPSGGQRGRFMAVALEEIPQRLLAGTGPNAYVSTIGKIDALTAEGWPVHNSFLLMVGELGLAGCLVLFLPWVVTQLSAIRRIRWRGAEGDFARSTVGLLPGMLLVANTGWAMTGQSNFALWMLVSAFCLAQMRGGSKSVAPVETPDVRERVTT